MQLQQTKLDLEDEASRSSNGTAAAPQLRTSALTPVSSYLFHPSMPLKRSTSQDAIPLGLGILDGSNSIFSCTWQLKRDTVQRTHSCTYKDGQSHQKQKSLVQEEVRKVCGASDILDELAQSLSTQNSLKPRWNRFQRHVQTIRSKPPRLPDDWGVERCRQADVQQHAAWWPARSRGSFARPTAASP